MRGPRYTERGKSAQSCPVSGRDRTASRTMVPPILLTQNRHPHRRWRGRFAVLDPARSLPGDASCLTGSGGQNDTSTAYRRASGRTSMERRSCRNPADQGRTGGGPGAAGSSKAGGVTAGSGRHRQMLLRPVHDREWGIGAWRSRKEKGRQGRQDERNGAMPFGHHAITRCLHIVFSAFRHGANIRCMAPFLVQDTEFTRFLMAPWAHWRVPHRRAPRHG